MNTSDQNTIIWQKWQDPFGDDDDIDTHNFSENDELDDDPSFESNKKKLTKGVKVIATPMGIIPFNDNTASGKIFNFWLAHCNFDITKEISEIIEFTPGVECLDIFTRYRFRIAIGKAFSDSSVMSSIQNNIYNYLNNNEYK